MVNTRFLPVSMMTSSWISEGCFAVFRCCIFANFNLSAFVDSCLFAVQNTYDKVTKESNIYRASTIHVITQRAEHLYVTGFNRFTTAQRARTVKSTCDVLVT